jgi:NAD(P)H-dependent flavin oxidoreductase YrpB (nitropropane dioxygenase family)
MLFARRFAPLSETIMPRRFGSPTPLFFSAVWGRLQLQRRLAGKTEIDENPHNRTVRNKTSNHPGRHADGELDAGAWSCGMVAGLIHDIPTCKELIERIMVEAEAIIRSRLEALLAA